MRGMWQVEIYETGRLGLDYWRTISWNVELGAALVILNAEIERGGARVRITSP